MSDAPPTVLLVDANPSDLSLIRLLLQRDLPTAIVRTAQTAAAFAESVAQDRIDAVVCDSALPWANGEDLAAVVRRRHPGCVVVLCAAHAGDAFVHASVRARADACLVKDSEGMLALGGLLADAMRRRGAPAVPTAASAPHAGAHPRGILHLNVRGRITHVDEAGARLLGVGAADLTGEYAMQCMDAKALRSLWDRRQGADKPVHALIEAGGAPLMAALRGVEDEQGALAGYELALEPAHGGAGLALAQQAERLRRANEELEQLTFALSHDLQEPLQLAARHLSRLSAHESGRLGDEGRRALGHVERSVERMQSMLDSILAYSRVGVADDPLDDVDLDRLLDETIIDLGGLIEEHGADLAHGHLPALRVNGREMTQLFRNLITNAIKFRRDEPPKVDIRAEERNGEWVFAVADNGIGIDAQHADRVFGMFQRLHTEDEYPGTGVGLALCKRIVERHGGRIWLRSEPGRGTTFYFSLPKRGGVEQPDGVEAPGGQRARQ